MRKNKFVALIGLGWWGKNLLRVFHEIGCLHTACDANPDTLTKHREEFSAVQYCSTFQEVLSNPDIRAVAIATPAATHYEIVKKSLAAGKDVLVEKPLALTVNEGKELVDLAEKEKKILMVGHILRYHPAVIKLKEIVSSGRLGRIQYIYSNRLNIGRLRTEENILWSFAPHDISVILSLVGSMPVKVSAFGGDYLNTGIQDVTLTTMEFKNRVKAHVFVSWLHPYKEQKLIVVGSKAMAVFDDLGDEKLRFYPHTIEWKNGKIPVAQKADHKIIPVEEAEPLRLELGHFIDCVISRKTPKTDGIEALGVLAVLERAEASLADV